MTPPPDDHTLNACLARVIGKEVDLCWNEQTKRNEIPYCDHGSKLWHPLHNADQMEEVEAWLIENKIHIVYVWAGEMHYFDLLTSKVIYKPYRSCDPDKKRAFALAILEMMKCDNIQKTELPVS